MKTTKDAFLGGQVLVKQPTKGYRAGLDAVLLAASIQALPGERILDIGCGVGTASLCLNARIPNLRIYGIDAQESLITLAQENAALFPHIHFMVGHLEKPFSLEKNSFHHVITNPPYFREAASIPSPDSIRHQAHIENVSLHAWIELCLKYVKPKGCLTIIHCAERLDHILQAIPIKRRSIQIIPIFSKQDQPAKRVIIRIIKDKCAPLSILPPLVLHQGETYTPLAQQILREGKGIEG